MWVPPSWADVLWRPIPSKTEITPAFSMASASTSTISGPTLRAITSPCRKATDVPASLTPTVFQGTKATGKGTTSVRLAASLAPKRIFLALSIPLCGLPARGADPLRNALQIRRTRVADPPAQGG